VVFDFDGTLAELHIDFTKLRRKIEALAEAMLEARPKPSDLPVLEWLDQLSRDAEQSHGRDTALELHCRGRLIVQAVELDAARQGAVFPYARRMLAGLCRRGVATGVITRNSTAAVLKVFPEIRECCGVFLPREDAPALKPDPAHLLAALSRLNVEPERALMVGDHPLDIETGQRAGSLTAGVATGRLELDELAEEGPDFLAKDAEELVRLLVTEGWLPRPAA
jgi:phosphoglycolate phosphatase